ncbi:ABC transporter substrate-binding protein [Plantibacter sp. Leaf171]|uniref:extracellular solute-binding protein n=1 Tax=unclassified Plantibacter TaxID=2624265 RepID=UPI0006F7AA90|nr:MULTISPECIES: extracellular solute-binding protein [unclassified Plantibacter]KQM16331.1 ABC transporter substrate-binding protein [Plantibacter sp. Leaf1]KQR59464.1 ABC transporter substrate-binding protein [Plantibacter sp. Leaf171]
MKRSAPRSLAIAALVIGALGLSACSAGGDAGSDGGGDASGPLIVYTNSNGDGRGEWVTAEAKKAGIDIEIVGLGGADLANRIVAEKNNPVGDVVFGLNNMFFETLKAEEAITAYKPAWSGEVDQASGDPKDGAFWPLVEQAIVTVYDTNTIPEADAPTELSELWEDSKYQGKYEVNTVLGQATPQLVLAGLLAPYKDADGDLGISDKGWKVVEEYFKNGSPAVEGTDLYARLTRGEVDFGTIPSSGITSRDAEYGTKTGVIAPKSGVPYVTEQIAEIAGTKREQQAQKFIDWFGSAETQGAFAKEFSAYPVNEKAKAEALPEVVALIDSLPKQDIDFEFVRENIGAWVEKTELEYLP